MLGRPSLYASMEDRLAAKRKSKRESRRRKVALLVSEGRCVRCKRKRDLKATRCAQCTAGAREENWRRYQRTQHWDAKESPGPVDWNFDTDDLITEHMGMAKRMALSAVRRLPSTSADVDDMIGDAFLGLVMAGRTFDPSREVPFEPWAAVKIKSAVYGGVKKRTYGRMKVRPVFVELQDCDGADEA